MQLSLKDTNILKGLAIILMLIHHLFWKQNGLYDDVHLIDDRYMVNQIGIFAKVCVAIFVFLSGYGLTVQAEKIGGIGKLRDFYFHRFKKLYLNYWFIWLIFVPISVFVFGRSFQTAFPDETALHTILDFFGIHHWFYSRPFSYNATWWFYSCIISLYLLFPLLYRLMKVSPLMLIIGSIAISFMPFSVLSLNYYIVVFVIGMMTANHEITPPSQFLIWVAWLVLLGVFCVERMYNKYPLMIDCFVTLTLVMVYSMVKLPKVVETTMVFIGRHSMNIFLFHTFIFSYWFRDVIYASRCPIVIFLLLLSVCLAISVLLEVMKKYTIYRLLK